MVSVRETTDEDDVKVDSSRKSQMVGVQVHDLDFHVQAFADDGHVIISFRSIA